MDVAPSRDSFTVVTLRGVPTQQRVRKPEETDNKHAAANYLPDAEAEETVPFPEHVDSQAHRSEKDHENGPENGPLRPRRTAHATLDEEKNRHDSDGDDRVIELRRMPEDSVRIGGKMDSGRA